MLDGLIDIYLPDLKYASGSRRFDAFRSARLSCAFAMEAIHGDEVSGGRPSVVERGVARRGLLIRHLVLPAGLAGTRKTYPVDQNNSWPKNRYQPHVRVLPCVQANAYRLIDRRLRSDEYDPLAALMGEEGFENVFIQAMESAGSYRPDFAKKTPFHTR